jgi:DNA-binding NarL/FixJ family response regulator
MNADQPVKVLLTDDHLLFLEGIRSLLATEPGIEVVGIATSGPQALEMLRKHPVDIAVLDVSMPGMDGVETTQRIKRQFPQVKVIALTMSNTEKFILGLRDAGASGYILKDRGREELVSAIHAVAAGDQYYSREVANTLMNSISRKREEGRTQLTERELEVLKLIGHGKTTPEIAELLFVAQSTVETHRRNLLSKLGLRNSLELVRYAIGQGLLD